MADMLNHYLKLWDLTDPEPLAETATSHVYTVTSEGTRVVLKVLTPIGVEERNGAIALRYWNGRGSVKLLRQDEQTHLLEYADGQDLTVLVKNGQDEEATLIIADVLNQLHAPSMSPMPTELMPLKIWLRDLFKKAEEDRRTGIHSIYMRAASTADSLFAEPYDICVLHGDIHHENIRHSSQRGWLAFDPKGLIGERTYDAANTLCNPVDMPELVENEVRLMKNAEILAQKLMIDRTRILAFVFVYVCLSASWRLYDGQDPVHDLRIAEIVEPYIQV